MDVTYPCVKCSEPCSETKCILCYSCDRWIHAACVPMTDAVLKSWDKHLMNFYCPHCCFIGTEFDAVKSLRRLGAAFDAGKRKTLLTTATNEQLLISTYNVTIPERCPETTLPVDSVSESILRMFHPVLLQEFYPSSAFGDGNCMYRAVSKLITGTERYHSLLRLKTAFELINNQSYYDSKSKKFKDLICDPRIFVSDYEKLVENAIRIGAYSEMAHIYALSSSLSRPIRSYYPPQLSVEFLSEPFSRKVVGRKVKVTDVPLGTVMWTQMHVPRTAKDFQANHFVPLLSRSAPVELFVDLESSDTVVESKSATSVIEDLGWPSKSDFTSSPLKSEITLQSEADLDWPSRSNITNSENSGKLYSSGPDSKTFGFSAPLDASDCSLKQQKKSGDFQESFNQTEPGECQASVGKTDSGDLEISVDSEAPKLEASCNFQELFDQREPDDCQASVDKTDSVDCENSVDSESSKLIDSADMDNDENIGGPLNGAFLDVNSLIKLLQQSDRCLEKIPTGLKENVYFVVKNDHNFDKRKKGQNSRFSDDCGVWQGSKGGSPITTFLILPSGELKGIVKREDVYCFKRKLKGKYHYVQLNPQPLENELVELHRYYTKLKLDETYQKRVSWLGLGGDLEIAVVEYIGKYPGVAPHGNAKYKTEYIRTPDNVMTEMAEMLKSSKPKQVYDKLTNRHDELSGPTDPRQVRDMKRRQDMKERQQAGLTGGRQNIADHIIEIENKVSQNDPYIRSVIRQNGKAPCIILYSDEQIQDLKLLCCTGKTVLGVDKTFNLCDMHVTVTCYKQLSVTKSSTSEPPLFIGPIFIHDNSDFDTYSHFFFNLKIKLNNVETSNLVIGTDDERAMVNAIKTAFPEAHHILCTRHLRQNATQKLTDDTVDKYDKKILIEKIFGDDGLLRADDTICFEEKCEEIESISQSISKNFLKYFQKRLKDLIREKRKDPEVATESEKMWTNNNCESINHVLKQAIEWKSKPLMDFIVYANELVDAQFKDLKRALVSTGQFRLADSHRQFAVSKSVWSNKTDDERNKLYRRFRNHEIKKPTPTEVDRRTV